MKILAINGSPHGMTGNTGRLLDEVLAGVQEGGAEVELVLLSRAKVQPCLSCEVCHRVGSCPVRDDFEEISGKLLACDGFILASPNYIFSVTAQLKSFFDRCSGLIHLMALEGKYGAAIETSGGGGDDEVLNYMARFINVLGARSVGGIGSPMAGMRKFPAEEELFARARQLGRDLCAAVQEKRLFPEQDGFHNAFKERMRMLMEYRKGEWTYEYEYWQMQGRAGLA
jgi:multimeric flavodoxin WrbA